MTRAVENNIAMWRFATVGLFLLVLLGALLWRVVSLQVLDTERGFEFLQGQGDARTVRFAEIPAHRGKITDRHGAPVAVSTPVVSIWINPSMLVANPAAVKTLATALDRDFAKLTARIQSAKGRRFLYLNRHMRPVEARAVLAHRLPGVYGEREYKRFYPAAEVAAHVVGVTDVDDVGIEGMELAYDDWLQGQPGRKRYVKDLSGDLVRDLGVETQAQPGRDMALSIDLRLQYLAYRELQAAIQRTGAASGSVVSLDTRTGEVLAMVNYPTYNPNRRQDFGFANYRNRAVTDLLEPGSTVKPLTLLAALESGLYTPDTMVDTAPGRIRVDRKVVLDPRNYGQIPVSTVLAKSSQVGTSKIALSLDEGVVRDMFARFGLGELIGTGYPGEVTGELPQRQKWRAIETATLAYGYGLTVTPMQLAQAYSVLANRGSLIPISLLRQEEPPVGTQVVDRRLTSQILAMLTGVTSAGGTATRAAVPGYSTGGKTGTAHKVGAGGYAADRYVAAFAGIAPVSDPRLVTVVVINEPKGDRYHGGEVAAPVFARIVAESLRLLNVSPDLVVSGGAA